MTHHTTGPRDEWLAARLELLEAEKELTRRGDKLAPRRDGVLVPPPRRVRPPVTRSEGWAGPWVRCATWAQP
jgi:predicted dithiol-disulfide oxidoreductase (DUF899 family)